MMIGYVRVSTQEQNTARQEELMKSLNVDKVFIDKVSGKDTKRTALNEMLSYIREGDTVIVESISRFARNTKDFLILIETLTEKGVCFISKKEAFDTSTPNGKFVVTVFAALAELEREITLQRQREGIEIAKREGKYKGRKRIERSDFPKVYQLWKNKEITATDAMKRLDMSRTTFYRRVREIEKHDEQVVIDNN